MGGRLEPIRVRWANGTGTGTRTPGNKVRLRIVRLVVTEASTDPGTVTFFWRPGCGFCARLKTGLLRAGVSLDERNIWEDPDAAAFVRSVARGNETVPTVVVAGQALVNPPADEVVALLG